VTIRPPRPTTRRRGAGDGVVTVFVADEQHAQPVDVARWSLLAEQVLAAEGVQGEAELSVLFVDRETIAALNHDFMEADGPTDVLSFPIDGELAQSGRWPDEGGPGPDRGPADPDDLPLLLGDIVICPDVAAANAPDHAGSLDDELALLVVHGLLHLLGMDHAEPAEREAMQARERDLLDRLHGPLARDPWTA
jgi:probable rRNA maturation factor